MRKQSGGLYSRPELMHVDLLDKILILFPFLREIDRSHHESLNEVVLIIDQLAGYEYNSKSKYEIMWAIIRLGNLFDSILPEKITDQVSLKTIDAGISDRKLCSELDLKQQWCLFKIARNICSDFCHIMYEEQAREFLGQVTLLCQGQNTCDSLINLSRQYTRFSRGRDLEKLLKNDKPLQVRLFNQAGYFMIRANEFFMIGNIPAASMALLGSCNCARFIFVSKMKGDQELPGMAKILEFRGFLAHTDLTGIHVEKQLSAIKSVSGNLDDYLVKLQEDAHKLELAVDAKVYKDVEKPKEEDESPRGLPKGLI